MPRYAGIVSKVIQIRGVPDEVHRRLVEAAEEEGQSLTGYLSDELRKIADRRDAVRHNREVIAKLRAEFGAPRLSRDEVLRVLDEGRAEREEQLVQTAVRRKK